MTEGVVRHEGGVCVTYYSGLLFFVWPLYAELAQVSKFYLPPNIIFFPFPVYHAFFYKTKLGFGTRVIFFYEVHSLLISVRFKVAHMVM